MLHGIVITNLALFCLPCRITGDEWDNSFTPRGWSKMVEAIESRMQDWSKLELVGKPLAFSDDESDESSEQTDSENEISDGEHINR